MWVKKKNPVICPYCNFTARPIVMMDNGIWKYVCNRCHKIFVP